MFELHPRLQQDCIQIGRFRLSRLLLMNDSHFPWFILVPERPGISEIYQLESDDRHQLMAESCHLSQALCRALKGDKINIAALGNLVPQLHVHHVVRYRNDAAWPAPIWGLFDAEPYRVEQIGECKTLLREVLGEDFEFFNAP